MRIDKDEIEACLSKEPIMLFPEMHGAALVQRLRDRLNEGSIDERDLQWTITILEEMSRSVRHERSRALRGGRMLAAVRSFHKLTLRWGVVRWALWRLLAGNGIDAVRIVATAETIPFSEED